MNTRSSTKKKSEPEVTFLSNSTPSMKTVSSKKGYENEGSQPALFNIHIHVPPMEAPKSGPSIQPQIHLHFNDILGSLTSGGALGALAGNRNVGEKIKSLFSMFSLKSDNLKLIHEAEGSGNRSGRRNSVKKITEVEEQSKTGRSSVGRKRKNESRMSRNNEDSTLQSQDDLPSLKNKLKNLVNGQVRKNLFDSSSECNLWSNYTNKDNLNKLKKAVVLLKDIGYREEYSASEFDETSFQVVKDFVNNENLACQTSTPKKTVNKKRVLEEEVLENKAAKKTKTRNSLSGKDDVEGNENSGCNRELISDLQTNKKSNLEIDNTRKSGSQVLNGVNGAADESTKVVERCGVKDDNCENYLKDENLTGMSQGCSERGNDNEETVTVNNEPLGNGVVKKFNDKDLEVAAEINEISESESDTQNEDTEEVDENLDDVGDSGDVDSVNSTSNQKVRKDFKTKNDKQKKGILVKDDNGRRHLNVSFDEKSIQRSKNEHEEDPNDETVETETVENGPEETLVEPENEILDFEVKNKKTKKPKEIESVLFSLFRNENKRKLRSSECNVVQNAVDSPKSLKNINEKEVEKSREVPQNKRKTVTLQQNSNTVDLEKNKKDSYISFTSEEETEETVPLDQPENAFWSVKRRNGKVYSMVYNSDSDSQEVSNFASSVTSNCNFSELLQKIKNKETREKILVSLKSNNPSSTPECGELIQESQNTNDKPEGDLVVNKKSNIDKKSRNKRSKKGENTNGTERSEGDSDAAANEVSKVEKKLLKKRSLRGGNVNSDVEKSDGDSEVTVDLEEKPRKKKSKKDKNTCDDEGNSGESEEALGGESEGKECNGAEGLDVSSEELSRTVQLQSEELEDFKNSLDLDKIHSESIKKLFTSSHSNKMRRSDKKTKVKPKSESKKFKSKKSLSKKSKSKHPAEKKSKTTSSEDYIPLNASGPTKFAVAPLNKIKPYEKHEAADLKNKLIFSGKNHRTKSLRVYKEKQKAAKNASVMK